MNFQGDVDYAENLEIKETRETQSEHWSKNQCTLFIGVWQWLDVEAWNRQAGELKLGVEVTAGGEKVGEARAITSFWARVLSKHQCTPWAPEDDMYVVEDAKGAA